MGGHDQLARVNGEESSTQSVLAELSSLRNPRVRPQWSLAISLVVVLGVALAIASGLGDASRALYTLFPLLLTVLFGLAAGFRTAVLLGTVTVGLVTLAAVVSATPLAAALAFAVVLLWLTVPTRLAPSAAIAPALQLAYFAAAAFGKPGVTPFEALGYAAAGLLGGMLLVLLIRAVDRLVEWPREGHAKSQEVEDTEANPGAKVPPDALTPVQALGFVLAAAVSAALLYWRLSTGSQSAAWVLLTFMLVFQPTHIGTIRQSLGRVAGTVLGFVLVVALFAVLPAGIATGLGLAALVPAIAYPKRDYVLSVAATTVTVVTLYGMPAGEYLAWGLERTADTLIGASLAVGLSVVVRKLEMAAGGRESV